MTNVSIGRRLEQAFTLGGDGEVSSFGDEGPVDDRHLMGSTNSIKGSSRLLLGGGGSCRPINAGGEPAARHLIRFAHTSTITMSQPKEMESPKPEQL